MTRLLALHARVTFLLLALTGCTARTSDMTERSDPHTIAIPAASTPTQPLDPSLVSPSLPTPAELIAASDLPAELPEPLPGDPFGVTIHRLNNGLTVYFSVDHQQPRFAAWIAIRAGGRHDPAHSTGLAHYLEHMLFKGTSKLGTLDAAGEAVHQDRIATLYGRLPHASGPARAELLAEIDAATQAGAATTVANEFDRLFGQLGILDVNAFTQDDATVYTTDVPTTRLRAWASVASEQLIHPTFRLFYPELEAVYEEKNMSLDSPDDRQDEALRLALFPGHPYGTQTILGDAEHLKNPAFNDMVDHHRRWYLPNNAAIILAGDLDPAAVLPVLEETFGTWPMGQVPEIPAGDLRGPVGRVERVILDEGEQSVTLAWRTVGAVHRDEPALYVLQELLDNGVCGLVNVRLVLSGALPDAESYGEVLSEAGYLALSGVARDDQKLADVERLLRGVVGDLKAGAFTQADLDAVVLHAGIHTQMAAESQGGRVAWIADAYLARRPWADHVAFTDRLRRVTRDDVIRVATTYLGDDHVVVLRRRGKHVAPKMPKPVITPVPIDPTRRSPYAAEILALPAREPEPRFLVEGRDYERAALASGPLIAARNARSDLFAVTLRWDVGTRRRPLLCHALDLLEQSGAGNDSAEALQRRLHQLGTDVDIDCDADATEISLTGVDTHLEASLALLAAWLRTPRFTDVTVEDLLLNTISMRRDELEEPESLADALAAYAARGEASEVLARPSDRQLRKARGPDLARELQELADLSHQTHYFGPRSAAAVSAALTFGAGRPVPPPPPRRLRTVDAPTVYFLHRDMAQAHVGLVLARPPLDPADRPAARLLTQVLDGDMSGLLFQEIREARGLAYRAGGELDVGARIGDDAALVGHLGTQADKAREALILVRSLLQSPELAEDRVTSARTALLRELRGVRPSPRRIPAWVQAWSDRGEHADPRPRELAQIERLGPAALAELVRRFAAAPPVVSVLGDRTRVSPADLRAIAGTVVEVKVRDLFPYSRG